MAQELLRPGPRAWRRVILVAAWVTIPIMGVLYTNHVQRESDHRWCELLVALTTDSPPPQPGRGEIIARILNDMKRDFDC